MPEIRRLASLTSTAALLLEGHAFISRRCRHHGTDAFETGIRGQRAVCLTEEEASRLCYGSGRLTRKRAIPRPTLTPLQNFGSVAVLDGDAHRHRNAMFMDLMSRDGIARLVGLAGREWDAVERWQDARGVRLLLEPEIVAVELLAAGDLSPLTSYQRRRGGAASSARTVAAVAAVSAARRS